MNELTKNELANLESRKKLIEGANLHFIHWFVIGLSSLLTLGAWYFSTEQLAQKVEIKFNREADQAVALIRERMGLYENALWGGVALADSNQGEVSYKQWLAYSNSLKIDKTYPGINGIGVIFNVQPSEIDAYLSKERQWRSNYNLHPVHSEAEHWPITYIEPAALNKKAIGLDMAFEKNRYTGIKKARDTGTAQLTGPITLVQDSKKTPGFLFYAPFYKKGITPDTEEGRQANVVGVTYAPFIMYKLMQGTLASQNRHVSIKISDSGELLYEDNEIEGNDEESGSLHKKLVDIEFYGRVWSFDIQSNFRFLDASYSNQPRLILIGGVIVDFLLLALFIFLTKVNRRALDYADKVTVELRNKTKRLEKSNQDLEQFSYVASHDLKTPLNGIKQLVGWIEEDCIDVLPEESKQYLKLLKQRTERMIKLLQDLLDYSRINQLDSGFESVNLREMVKGIFDLLGVPDSFACVAPDVSLIIPRIPLEIVLRNLISNAVKHHDQVAGKIEVSYESSANMHVIRVQDDGPGIPVELQDKALEMFRTLRPRDQVEGSGMGLAIVKRIVEHHNGMFFIDPAAVKGTVLIIKFPFSVVPKGGRNRTDKISANSGENHE